jgi:hypothetical protein
MQGDEGFDTFFEFHHISLCPNISSLEMWIYQGFWHLNIFFLENFVKFFKGLHRVELDFNTWYFIWQSLI